MRRRARWSAIFFLFQLRGRMWSIWMSVKSLGCVAPVAGLPGEVEDERQNSVVAALLVSNHWFTLLILDGGRGVLAGHRGGSAEMAVRSLSDVATLTSNAALAFRDEIPSEADKLSPRRRRIAIEMIRNLIEAQQLEHQLAEGIRITAGMSPEKARAAMHRVVEIFPGLVEVVEHRSGVAM